MFTVELCRLSWFVTRLTRIYGRYIYSESGLSTNLELAPLWAKAGDVGLAYVNEN